MQPKLLNGSLYGSDGVILHRIYYNAILEMKAL